MLGLRLRIRAKAESILAAFGCYVQYYGVFESEYEVLQSHSLARSVEMMRYSVHRLDSYRRVRCLLTNGDYLELALHGNVSKQGPAIDDYRYQ